MAGLLIENLSKTFPAGPAGLVKALHDFSLEVIPGELLVLLGPSGCGKTTLLRLIAGLDTPASGRILLNGESLAGKPPQARPIGMAFQYPALLPQLTVEQNIALGPKLRRVDPAEAISRVRLLAQRLALTSLLSRAPETLSGGQQQRVSLARALANHPALLLLDEPLANLDPISRHELRDAIRRVHRELRITTLYVTHDQSEAAAVADRIAILQNGSLQQIGTAAELYHQPRNLFVAEFFAPHPPNILPGKLLDGHFHPEGCAISFPTPFTTGTPGAEAIALIRPEAILAGGPHPATIEHVQHTGWSTSITLNASGLALRAELPPSPSLKPRDPFPFSVRNLLLFSPSGAAFSRSETG